MRNNESIVGNRSPLSMRRIIVCDNPARHAVSFNEKPRASRCFLSNAIKCPMMASRSVSFFSRRTPYPFK